MPIDRRRFLDLAAAGLAASAFGPALPGAEPRPRFKAVAFDAFPVFDPRPIAGLAEALFPGKGTELGNLWRTTEEGLAFAAGALGLALPPEKRDRLMQAYLELTAWPDAPAALRSAGVRLAFLSNMTAAMLESGIRHAKLDGVFEHVLSTDRIRSYKPDPRAYQMAVDAFGLAKQEILFVSFAGWDAAGAKWFGYPTYWNDRLGLPPEELGVRPDATARDLSDLPKFVAAPA